MHHARKISKNGSGYFRESCAKERANVKIYFEIERGGPVSLAKSCKNESWLTTQYNTWIRYVQFFTGNGDYIIRGWVEQSAKPTGIGSTRFYCGLHIFLQWMNIILTFPNGGPALNQWLLCSFAYFSWCFHPPRLQIQATDSHWKLQSSDVRIEKEQLTRIQRSQRKLGIACGF